MCNVTIVLGYQKIDIYYLDKQIFTTARRLELSPVLLRQVYTVAQKTNGTRYYVKWENQLLHFENLELKNGLYLI